MNCENCGYQGSENLVRVDGKYNIIHCPKCYEVLDVENREVDDGNDTEQQTPNGA